MWEAAVSESLSVDTLQRTRLDMAFQRMEREGKVTKAELWDCLLWRIKKSREGLESRLSCEESMCYFCRGPEFSSQH